MKVAVIYVRWVLRSGLFARLLYTRRRRESKQRDKLNVPSFKFQVES